MADSSVLIRNKRYETMAATLWQLGAALLAAAAVKSYVDGGPGLEASFWFMVAAVLMAAGWNVLGLLEAET